MSKLYSRRMETLVLDKNIALSLGIRMISSTKTDKKYVDSIAYLRTLLQKLTIEEDNPSKESMIPWVYSRLTPKDSRDLKTKVNAGYETLGRLIQRPSNQKLRKQAEDIILEIQNYLDKAGELR